jgi:hypothetical protein
LLVFFLFFLPLSCICVPSFVLWFSSFTIFQPSKVTRSIILSTYVPEVTRSNLAWTLAILAREFVVLLSLTHPTSKCLDISSN